MSASKAFDDPTGAPGAGGIVEINALEEGGRTHADKADTYLNTGEAGNVDSDAQDGVKMAQATTIAWSRKALILTYGLIFLIYFINSLQQQTTSNLTAYVTSAFGQHSLVATTGIMSTLIAGVIKLPLAKLMDVFGRPQGFAFSLVCAVLGLIMMAACNNVTTYSAAQVFYWTGMNNMDYALDVVIADTSSLKYRALMFAFSSSPFIATTFAGPAAAESFYETSGWRWAFGTYTIITPVICAPFLFVFWYNQREAVKQGILIQKREASGRTALQSLHHYLIEFDFIGMIFLIAGWALLLLPLSLATYQESKWRSPSIIAMLVIGFCCQIAFGIHERFFAKRSLIPFHYLLDRTVVGTCLLSGTLWISFYCWNAYFTSFLQVVFDMSIENAGYMAAIYNIGSCFWAVVIGAVIPWTGRFKWLAMCAVPLQILGTGLMIHFRQPGQHIGYVIMCQIFIAISGGTLVVTEQLAIMAAVGPENVAVALALQGLFTSIGGSIGSSISGAIWTNTMPGQLERFLPDELKGEAMNIYADLTVQLGYEWGSPGREAIVQAYAFSQRYMCVAATAVLALAMVFVMMWRDISVKDFKKPLGAKIV